MARERDGLEGMLAQSAEHAERSALGVRGRAGGRVSTESRGPVPQQDFRGPPAAGLGPRLIGRGPGRIYARIDKRRQNHPAAGVDLLRIAGGVEVFYPAGGADFLDDPVAHQQRAVGKDAQVRQRQPAAGRRGPAQRQQLPGASQQPGGGHR
jgi:hypothetical protein